MAKHLPGLPGIRLLPINVNELIIMLLQAAAASWWRSCCRAGCMHHGRDFLHGCDQEVLQGTTTHTGPCWQHSKYKLACMHMPAQGPAGPSLVCEKQVKLLLAWHLAVMKQQLSCYQLCQYFAQLCASSTIPCTGRSLL